MSATLDMGCSVHGVCIVEIDGGKGGTFIASVYLVYIIFKHSNKA